jgi:DNA-binding Lrp family transcriptional regulator
VRPSPVSPRSLPLIRQYARLLYAGEHGFEVLLAVTMDREESVAGFEAGLEQIPEVVHAERLFGEPDYFVRVATADIATFQRLRDERLARLQGVQRMTSTIVMKKVVDNRPLPT